MGRVLMYGKGDAADMTLVDLLQESVSVYGVGSAIPPATGYRLGPIPVGRSNMTTRQPAHN
jgi:hypothetical protein